MHDGVDVRFDDEEASANCGKCVGYSSNNNYFTADPMKASATRLGLALAVLVFSHSALSLDPSTAITTFGLPLVVAAWGWNVANLPGTIARRARTQAVRTVPDREVRRSSAKAITEALRRDLRTRAYIFNVMLQDKAIGDRLRKYPTWISSRPTSKILAASRIRFGSGR